MSKKFFPTYLFSGPEVGQKRERIEAIASGFGDGGDTLERHRVYPYDTSISDVLSLLRNGSLFASKKLLVMGDVEALSKADRRAFKEYITAPAEGCILILTTERTPVNRDYPRELARVLPKEAVSVFWEMFERDKRGWVFRFLRERGFRPVPGAVDLLLDRTEGTTNALREACELLAFMIPSGQEIREEDVDRSLEHLREETFYSLFDRFCRRDLAGVLEALRSLFLNEAEEAERLLTRFAKPLATLKEYIAFRESRMNSDEVMQRLQIRGGKRSQLSYEAGKRNYRWQELSRALQLLVEAESWIRTAPREVCLPRIELWLIQVIGSTPN